MVDEGLLLSIVRAMFRNLDQEIVVTDKTEYDAVTIYAIVSHHLPDGYLAGTGTLVDNILNKV